MDFENLESKVAKKEAQEPGAKLELFYQYQNIMKGFAELARLLEAREINLGEIDSTVHTHAGMGIAQIRGMDGMEIIPSSRSDEATTFLVCYSLRSQNSMFRFPVAEELFGVEGWLRRGPHDWDSWDMVEVEGRIGTMIEEGPKTLAMIIEAAKNPDLNDPDLADKVRRHYAADGLSEAV